MTTTPRRVTNTAGGSALMKALEAYTPPEQRLFDDPILERLLPAPARTLVAVGSVRRWMMRTFERTYPGLLGNFVYRTRQMDDVTRQALRDGARSVVILGAGFDTRAYRMPELARVPVFELDFPGVVAKKRAALVRAGVSSARGSIRPRSPAISRRSASRSSATWAPRTAPRSTSRRGRGTSACSTSSASRWRGGSADERGGPPHAWAERVLSRVRPPRAL